MLKNKTAAHLIYNACKEIRIRKSRLTSRQTDTPIMCITIIYL